MMTLTSLPLVLHEMTKKAVMAGLKYLFYSVAGAFLALYGIFYLYGAEGSLTFTPGGVSMGLPLNGHEGLFLGAVCCMLVGFGTKAGMFPLHGWLPTAHPVAPAPASAVLSGLITKSGVLAVIRVVYYIVGPDRLRGHGCRMCGCSLHFSLYSWGPCWRIRNRCSRNAWRIPR